VSCLCADLLLKGEEGLANWKERAVPQEQVLDHKSGSLTITDQTRVTVT
jgi:hypothetical protein